MKDKPLVIVEWRDIIATAGWEQEISCPTLFTVGWLISRDDNTIVIANTKDPDDFTGESKTDPPVYYGLHAFPSGAVVHVHPCDPVHTCEVESPLSLFKYLRPSKHLPRTFNVLRWFSQQYLAKCSLLW